MLEILDRQGLRLVLENRVGIHRLAQKLLEFQRVCLQNLQALTHLRRQSLLLGQRLMKGGVWPWNSPGGSGIRWQGWRKIPAKLKQILCQRQRRRGVREGRAISGGFDGRRSGVSLRGIGLEEGVGV